MNSQLVKGQTYIQRLRGLEFVPSAELRKTPGVTWDNDDQHIWYVATVDMRQVACVGMFVKNRSARFKTDVVLPEYRGQGLYRMLFNMREDHARTLADEATTFSNQQSRHQYEKAGFKPVGEESARGVLYMKKVFDKPPKRW